VVQHSQESEVTLPQPDMTSFPHAKLSSSSGSGSDRSIRKSTNIPPSQVSIGDQSDDDTFGPLSEVNCYNSLSVLEFEANLIYLMYFK